MAGPSSDTAVAAPAVGSKGEAKLMDNGVLPTDDETVAEEGDAAAVAPSAATDKTTDTQDSGIGDDILRSAKTGSDDGALTDDDAKVSSPRALAAVSEKLTLARAAVSEKLNLARAAVSEMLTPARAAFALFTLVALWSSAGHPRRSVWTFSVIASSYLALWTIFITAAIRASTVLVSVSYIMLFAATVTHLSPDTGVFIMLLDTAYAAGLFGYALADFRQRRGTERSAEAIPDRSEEEVEEDRGVIAMVSFYATFASFSSAVAAAWVVYYFVDMYRLVLVLSLLIDLSVFCWTALVAVHLLHGALIAYHTMSFIYWGGVSLLLPDFLLSYLFGQAIGVLVHLVGVIGMAGFFGYCLSVYGRYKRMVMEDPNGKNKKVA